MAICRQPRKGHQQPSPPGVEEEMAPKPTDLGNAGTKRALSRRQVLSESGAVLGGAVIGGLSGGPALAEDASSNLPPNIPEWMKAPGDPMGSQPYGAPSPFEKNVVKNIS